MTTATKTRTTTSATTGVLKDLEEREAAVAALAATERETGAEFTQAAESLRALHQERHRLLTKEPGLFDHRGGANGDIEDNPVTLVDAAIAKSANVGDLQAKYEHAKRLRNRGEQGLRDWTKSRTDELAEALRPVLLQRHIEAQGLLDQTAEAVADYSALGRRFEVLTGERLSALEHVSNLHRLLRQNGVPEVGA